MIGVDTEQHRLGPCPHRDVRASDDSLGFSVLVGVSRVLRIIEVRGPNTEFDIVKVFPEKVMAGPEGRTRRNLTKRVLVGWTEESLKKKEQVLKTVGVREGGRERRKEGGREGARETGNGEFRPEIGVVLSVSRPSFSSLVKSVYPL